MRTPSHKTTITTREYQQLLGLFVLGHRSMQKLNEIAAAAAELLAYEPHAPGDYGYIGDALYNEDAADTLLAQLGIAVDDNVIDSSALFDAALNFYALCRKQGNAQGWDLADTEAGQALGDILSKRHRPEWGSSE